MPNLFDFIKNNGEIVQDEEMLKTAHEIAVQEEEMRKVADEHRAYGMFIGKGVIAGMMDKVAESLNGNGVDNVNPVTAAQSPAQGGILIPTDAPGPNQVLKTTRPGGGEQHNNDMFAKKLDEKRLKAGLHDLQNNGIAILSGSDHGTSAQFSIDHKQGR